MDTTITFNFDEMIIKFVEKMKYLEVIFNKKLKFKSYINKIMKKNMRFEIIIREIGRSK